MSELPTGTVTLLLADAEGSTRLWESQPEVMKAAVARLDETLATAVPAHNGVRPLEQGEGDSFVIAFARAADAVACALELQQAPLAPIKLRIGLHTGDIQLRDEGNYIGPTINRTARLRDLAHGGQTVLSGATEPLVLDQLPPDVTLTDLGTHQLRDLPRPERVIQLHHPDLHNDFPPLRTQTAADRHLPTQLTSFIGRQPEIKGIKAALADNRVVTLFGAGGVGKTRLAVQAAGSVAADYADGVWYVDLAPITHPGVVPVTVARALGLPDQPTHSTAGAVALFIGNRQILMLLDNCEHLLDACAELVTELLAQCPQLTVLTTSREPIGVDGEVVWRVPSLSLTTDALALFADRAGLSQRDFTLTDGNAETVGEICRRLDGMPLAIELAAARVRALSLQEILDSLHDRFRLLTGGSRTAVRRQQTLCASVDWSHALLTDTERILFRRLAVFLGGFDLDGVHAVAGEEGTQRYQTLDQLTLLVDKSLVVAENNGSRTRYRLLETVRQYALEKIGESGEADAIRTRHRDYYTSLAAALDAPARDDYQRHIGQASLEIDNLRGAFGWDLEVGDIDKALALTSSLQPIWTNVGRMREGRAWFETALAQGDETAIAPAIRARGLADKSVMDSWTLNAATDAAEQAQRALAIARDLDDPALLARALTSCGLIAGYDDKTDVAKAYFAEAIGILRTLDDRWTLSRILALTAYAAVIAGDATATRAAAEEGLALARSIGNLSDARECGAGLGWALLMQGEVADSVAQFREVFDEVVAAHALMHIYSCAMGLDVALAYHGEGEAARTVAEKALTAGTDIGEYFRGMGYMTLTHAAFALGDVDLAGQASAAAWQRVSFQALSGEAFRPQVAAAAMVAGDLDEAFRQADQVAVEATGWHLATGLVTRARAALRQGDTDKARDDAQDALTCAIDSGAILTVPDALECLAATAAGAEAARLFGAAEAYRAKQGVVRFQIHQDGYQQAVDALQKTMEDKDFSAAWDEGAALSVEQATAYAQRGRGERRRASSGWESLTRAELDVAKLVSEGLSNREVASRLFISPRTVQAHLTHIYTKLGLTSRVQLAQEAARHS